MITLEEHRRHLHAFEVDRLLKMLALEAAKYHNREYAILSSASGYQVAFEWPADGAKRRALEQESLPTFPTLKQAVIEALISGKTYDQYSNDSAIRRACARERGWLVDNWMPLGVLTAEAQPA